MANILAEGQFYTQYQWKLLLLLGMVNFLNGLILSIQAPFYPKEMHLIGPKTAFNTGILTAATSTILFGFLDQVTNHLPFITLSFFLRITEALGSSTVFIAIYTFVTREFPTSIATTFAVIETLFGFGICLGPTLGAAFFELGGFTAPFAILGGTLFATAVLSSPLITNSPQPNQGPQASAPLDSEEVHQGIFALLKVPEICFYSLVTISGAISNGFLAATLEPFLRIYNLTPMKIGLTFLIYGVVYALTAPFFGTLCDRVSRPKYVTLAGALLILGGFLLIGPSSIIPLESQMELTIIGLILFGMGSGACFVSSFLLSMKDAKKFGFPDNAGTYSLVSGVWRSSLALGAFLGPSIAGFLYDEVGFRKESLFVVGLQSILTVIIISFIVKDYVSTRNNTNDNYFGLRHGHEEEVLPLLEKSQRI